eukprot:CAMPEP_0119003282 /NCGR_PEP_ID=MMETSP1176-20130426/470_1 /TAXON_ID=265551 /ORGANISM="Synedropsis recta cf, Strain CCMP1620" /LENGTH=54 /DNA_ID=CAMNT_0006954871 /DNA_START=89 /DNA_END=249 /DNA_ORIENTATION=-
MKISLLSAIALSMAGSSSAASYLRPSKAATKTNSNPTDGAGEVSVEIDGVTEGS